MQIKAWANGGDLNEVISAEGKLALEGERAERYDTPLFFIDQNDKLSIYKDFLSFSEQLGYQPDLRRQGNGFKSALTQSLWRGFLGGRTYYE